MALGTDSRASNPDLNLLAEMRHVARMHPTIDPHDVLRMGTLTGAEALGRAEDVGSLAAGKLAKWWRCRCRRTPRNAGGVVGRVAGELRWSERVWVRGELV